MANKSAGVTASRVGRLLQHWRRVRRKSQLALAVEAEVSPRHLCFVETGRASPSREMVLILASALDVPLRERNDLLLAAGYAPVYRETDLAAPELAQARKALDCILLKQEPYPAVVMDRYWNIVMTNLGAERLFGSFLDLEAQPTPANVLRLIFHPGGLRPFVDNWEVLAEALVQRAHREAVGGIPDEETMRILDEILAYPGVPRRFRTPDFASVPVPFIPVQLRKHDLALAFFSTVTTLGTPQDITLQEIRIECFFPADAVTETWSAALTR